MPPSTVNVDRTTLWGISSVAGAPRPLLPDRLIADKWHAFPHFPSFAPINAKLVDAARAQLRGKNVACWCARKPYEDESHTATLLALASGSPSNAVAPCLKTAIERVFEPYSAIFYRFFLGVFHHAVIS